MLQEIIDRITQPGKTVIGKFQNLLFDATVGLFRDYQKKTLELVQITAASYYLQGVQALRKAALGLFLVTLASIVFSVAAVVVPIAFVMVSPWSASVKMISILVLGLVDMIAALVYMSYLFSEKRWMEITKSQEILEKFLKS